MRLVQQPTLQWVNSTKNVPVAQGFMYFGVVGQDPKIPENQITVFRKNQLNEYVEVQQPISLSDSGVPIYLGQEMTLYVEEDCAIRVDDRNGAEQYLIRQYFGAQDDTLRSDLAATGGASLVNFGTINGQPDSTGTKIASSVNELSALSNSSIFPEMYSDTSNKILWRNTTSKYYVFTKKASGGYLMFGFVNNSTTTSDSLATTTSETTRLRLSEVLNSVWVGVYEHENTATSGAWTEPSTGGAFANMIPTYTSGRALKYWRADQNGSYIEFQAKPKNGKLNIALYSGASSASSATISVNGAVVSTIAPTAAFSNTIKVFDVPCSEFSDADTLTVRLTHAGSNGQALSVFGLNFYELSDYNGSDYDTFGYYRNSAFSDYLTQSSANDFVIREYVSNIYGVSFHGGETGIVSAFYDKGIVTAPAVDGFSVSTNYTLKGSASISWAALGGGSVTVAGDWYFTTSGLTHLGQMNGNIETEEIYTCMYGAPESFSLVTQPVKIDLTSKANGSRNVTGRTNFVQLKNPATGQLINADFSIYNDTENAYGGPHIWKVVGTYNKLYYGPCINGRQTFTDLGFSARYRFE